MKVRYINILLSLILTLAGMSSCVYPFEAELDGESGTFVIEGDVLIGEVMNVKLSYTAPINGSGLFTAPEKASVWVEDDKGGHYPGTPAHSDRYHPGEFTVDMTKADPSLKYRLRVDNLETYRSYASSWQAVCRAPQIDSLSYIVDEEKSKLNIALSMHSQSGSYFKWSYREDWEYHSEYSAKIKYLPPVRLTDTWNQGYGLVVDIVYPEKNHYYCWNYAYSSEIMLFSTESQTEDRFVDLEFHTIPRDNKRISVLYHIDVQLEPITKEAYLYWDNIKNNSEYNGNLFAPNPSEMVGNIRCLNDTTELVMGFINVAERDTQELFYNNSKERFYKPKYPFMEEPQSVSSSKEWYSMYSAGYLPYDYEEMGPSPTLWSLKENVDCTCLGGTKNKPSYWPNDHE